HLFTALEALPASGYVPAVREDSAVGIAAGAYLAGKKPVVLMQNSGLGVCLNAILSLNAIYAIPALLVVSWRGEGGKDAPERIDGARELDWARRRARAAESYGGRRRRRRQRAHGRGRPRKRRGRGPEEPPARHPRQRSARLDRRPEDDFRERPPRGDGAGGR